jgi:hypothetical protein
MPCVLGGRTVQRIMIPLIVMLVNLSGECSLLPCSSASQPRLVACILSVWYGHRNYPNSSSPLLEIFYVDGTIYFFVMGGEPSLLDLGTEDLEHDLICP